MTKPPFIPSYHEKVTISQLDSTKASKYQIEFEKTSFHEATTKLMTASPFDLAFLSLFNQNRNITSISFSSSESSDRSTPSFLSTPTFLFPTGVSIQLTTSAPLVSAQKESMPLPDVSFLRPLLESSHLLFPLGVSARSDLIRMIEQQYPTHMYSDSDQLYFLWNFPHQSMTYGVLHSSFLHQVKKEFSYPCMYHSLKNDVAIHEESSRIGILSSLFHSWAPSSSPLQITHRASHLHISREESDFNTTRGKKIRIRRVLRYTISLDHATAMENVTLQSLFHTGPLNKKRIHLDEDNIIRACPIMDTSHLKLQFFDSELDDRKLYSASHGHDKDECKNDWDSTSTCSSSTTVTDVGTERTDSVMDANRIKVVTVDLLQHLIPMNSTLVDIILHKADSVDVNEPKNIAPTITTISRTVKRPRGVWNSGTLETFVSNCDSEMECDGAKANMATNITIVDVYPNMIRPIWHKLGIFLIQHDQMLHDNSDCLSQNVVPTHRKKFQQLSLSGFSPKEAQLNLNDDGSSSLSLNMVLQPHTTLYIRLDYNPRFLPLDRFPADPNRGFDISPSYCIIHNYISTTTHSSSTQHLDSSFRIYSNSLLLMPPVPDMSMPYNVITITNSFIVLIIGVVTNVLTKKATKQIKDALKESKATQERISMMVKIRRKLGAYVGR